jgi:hypothetical protein
MGLKPGSDCLGGAVRQEIYYSVGLTIDEDSAVDATFSEGKVIKTENPWCWVRWQTSSMGTAQKGIGTRRHCGTTTLTSASLTTKGKSELAKSNIQACGALCSRSNKRGQTFSKCFGRTGRIGPAEAANMQQ